MLCVCAMHVCYALACCVCYACTCVLVWSGGTGQGHTIRIPRPCYFFVFGSLHSQVSATMLSFFVHSISLSSPGGCLHANHLRPS